MNVNDLKQLSKARRREAKALLDAKEYAGAYYLIGYSVECALKACIAKQTKKHDFPDKGIANKCWQHDLNKLLVLAGLGPEYTRDSSTNPALAVNWAIVKDWDVECRYQNGISREDAKELYSACTTHKNGVLPWIKTKW